jgi:two-component system phosphate regulon response regulator PhoB
MNSLLLVDDEPTISAELQRTLQKFGYHVELAATVEAAQEMVSTTHFDLLLVDMNLRSERYEFPNAANGTALVLQLRAAGITAPILIFTVLEDELNELAALSAGADEYVLKTISIPRLLARIQANIRRHERDLGTRPSTARWVGAGQFKLDREHRILAIGDKAIELTIREAKVMDALTTSPNRVFTCEEILDKAWGHDIRRSPAALESVLYRLRQKFQAERVQDLVENVKGKGYRLAPSSMVRTTR